MSTAEKRWDRRDRKERKRKQMRVTGRGVRDLQDLIRQKSERIRKRDDEGDSGLSG